jgi:NAD(P)-dependent dehydrogenase (short-subunit alcohol dehydrogenase family)
MDFHLEGKKALVTASTSGIGFAIAKALVQEGANVYIQGRSLDKVQSAINQISNPKGKLLTAPFDITTKEGLEKLLNEIPNLDILVNNLGIYETKNFEDITDEDWFHFFDINVMSGIRLSRHYFPKMIAKNWGRIIFISSESGVNIPSEMIHYGMTKTAQLAISRGLAELTKGTNVTVNSVLPGPTYSEGVKKFVSDIAKDKNKPANEVENELFQTLRPSSLIQRFASIEEVGDFVAFVCSKQAAAINGASLRVEGGVVRSIT